MAKKLKSAVARTRPAPKQKPLSTLARLSGLKKAAEESLQELREVEADWAFTGENQTRVQATIAQLELVRHNFETLIAELS